MSLTGSASRNDFAYWDANGNGDLTCTEASGKDEGLKLPAYRDNRDGTGVIYEWLERGTSSDSDSDGVACEGTQNPNGYVPSVVLHKYLAHKSINAYIGVHGYNDQEVATATG